METQLKLIPEKKFGHQFSQNLQPNMGKTTQTPSG